MTTATIKLAPVRKSITLDAPQAKAFEVFTARLGSWWPTAYSIGTSPIKNAIIEPRAGGRWYEVGEDGSQCDWGQVLEWDAPRRVLLAWRITSDWRYDPELLTELDVRFVALGEKTTRVDLEHRLLENLGDGAEKTRNIFDNEPGWGTLLAAYAVVAAKAA